MQLKEIYRPIEKELADVEKTLRTNLENTDHKSILRISDYLLHAKGKRIRPALAILSAKATGQTSTLSSQIISVASAVELIHLASLIHDDVIDHSKFRHNKLTINSKWGDDVSVTLGDYLYAVGFELVSSCKNTDILSCLTRATRLMCEGELAQVYERDNLNLLRERYIIIVKKKTASLFAASCQAGAIASHCRGPAGIALEEYGLNLGIAFQIVDDALDLIAEAKDLGKSPGADLKMGELTLPVLNLLSQYKERNKIIRLIRQKDKKSAFNEIKEKFINSPALPKTKEDISFYIRRAKESLNRLEDSSFRQSLFILADYITGRMSI